MNDQTNNPPKKIVIVEDDKTIQDLYKTILNAAGFTVLQATTGKEGLQIISQSHPDLVFLDIMLPDNINGFDILEKLKQSPSTKDIPIVILTNLETESQTARKIGAKDYIVKVNITPEQFLEKVRYYLS